MLDPTHPRNDGRWIAGLFVVLFLLAFTAPQCFTDEQPAGTNAPATHSR